MWEVAEGGGGGGVELNSSIWLMLPVQVKVSFKVSLLADCVIKRQNDTVEVNPSYIILDGRTAPRTAAMDMFR